MPSSSTIQRRRRDRRHAALVARARRGDGTAFGRLYRELQPPVHAYLCGRAPTPQDAEDLVARVFHRFVERLDTYDPGRGSVLAWLLTIAHHALVDQRRAMRPSLPVDDLAEVLASSEPDAAEGLQRDELERRLRRLLARLPTDLRAMFVMRYELDLRYRDIARRTGSTEAAVKQRFARALRQLRHWLAGEEVAEEAPPGRSLTGPAHHRGLPAGGERR